jgi:hypothetical protein
MSDPIARIIDLSRKVEEQLKVETEALNVEIRKRDKETRRARALCQIFQEKRFFEDVQNGRVCQPPIFYEAWNGVIGRLDEYVKGVDRSILPQMYASFDNTLTARVNAHNNELLQAIG